MGDTIDLVAVDRAGTQAPAERPTHIVGQKLPRTFAHFLDLPVCGSPYSDSPAPWPIRWLAWPIMFTAFAFVVASAIAFQWNLRLVNLGLFIGTLCTLCVLEFCFPLKRKYAMTWRSLLSRDAKYIVASRVLNPSSALAVQSLSLWISEWHHGILSGWPIWLAVLVATVTTELYQYWWHRLSHEASGPVARALWSLHVAHHLPEELYVLMRTVENPINVLFLAGPLLYAALGAAPQVIFVSAAFTTFVGLTSHANLDLRIGWINYVIVGPEIHRMHHSACPQEAKNFAAKLSFVDILFGTFVYRPGAVPARYGVTDPALYPRANEFLRTVFFPLVRMGVRQPIQPRTAASQGSDD